jgi:hypothetical protein
VVPGDDREEPRAQDLHEQRAQGDQEQARVESALLRRPIRQDRALPEPQRGATT